MPWADGDFATPTNLARGGATPTVFDVKSYGAKGDASTDDSTAIKKAVAAAAATTSGAKSNLGAVYFPPGIYVITESAVLTQVNTTSVGAGLHFFGAGAGSSILRLSTSGSDLYFYNNVATARMNFCSFSDLGFQGMDPADFSVYTDISGNAKGFRLWATSATGSHEQGFRFHHCQFQYFDTLMETAGDQTASENKFIGCRIRDIKTTVLKLENDQSFNHEFISTDIEVIYGDVFTIGSGSTRGGAIKMYGGSVIMVSDAAADKYFFKPTASTGMNAYPFVFSGLRMEMRGDNTNLVLIPTTQQFDVTFENTYILDTATSAKTAFCDVKAYATLTFKNCAFKEQGVGGELDFVVGDDSSQFGENGTITFDNCALPINWSDRCSTNGARGAIRAINCHGTNIGAPAAGAHWAHDFDMNWDESTPGDYTGWTTTAAELRSWGSPTNCSLRLKTALLILPREAWPDTQEQTLLLPRNAIIKNIYLRKPAGGTDATSTTFRVGRNDKSGTDHLVSDTQRMDAAHTGEATNLFYHVGTTANERTLRLYTDENPTIQVLGGFCIVEYY